jgi:hypothetical protein
MPARVANRSPAAYADSQPISGVGGGRPEWTAPGSDTKSHRLRGNGQRGTLTRSLTPSRGSRHTDSRRPHCPQRCVVEYYRQRSLVGEQVTQKLLRSTQEIPGEPHRQCLVVVHSLGELLRSNPAGFVRRAMQTVMTRFRPECELGAFEEVYRACLGLRWVSRV